MVQFILNLLCVYTQLESLGSDVSYPSGVWGGTNRGFQITFTLRFFCSIHLQLQLAHPLMANIQYNGSSQASYFGLGARAEA